MNFSKSKFVYVYDMSGKLLNKKFVGIECIKDSQGLESNDTFANALAQVNNGYYHNMIYDKWRKVFYRISIHFAVDNEIKTPEDLSLAFQKRTMTVTVFDKDLRVLAQRGFLTLQTFLMEDYYLLNQNGFYLRLTLPEEKENIYQFLNIELVEKEQLD